MNWEIDFSPLPVYIRVATAGTVAPVEHKAMWDEIISSEHWAPGTCVLMMSDANPPPGAESYQVTRSAVRYFVERDAEIGKSCIAVVRPGPPNYYHSRQFQYAIQLRGSSVVVRNFTDEVSAVSWLRMFILTRAPGLLQPTTSTRIKNLFHALYECIRKRAQSLSYDIGNLL